MNALKEIISRNYGFKITNITPGPRGFVAETYIIDTSNERYFAKVVKISRYSENIEAGLPALIELHEAGFDQISYPIATIDQQLSVKFDGSILTLYNFIEGEWTFDYDFEAYVALMAKIHQTTIRTPLIREAFDITPVMNALRRELDDLEKSTYTNPHQRKLQDIINEYRHELAADMANFDAIVRHVRQTNIPFVLTHGDASGNILQASSGKLYMIDWDDMLLAPRERDIWFHVGTNQATAEFLPIYQRYFPSYQVDASLFAFYLYKRYFEDVEGWCDKILDAETPDDEHANHLIHLDKDYLGWLRPAVRELDGKKLF
jgi:Ser/Thr protein kinase RdoA (MazF antagonist)